MTTLNIHGYKGIPHNAAYSALCGMTENIISPLKNRRWNISEPDLIICLNPVSF